MRSERNRRALCSSHAWTFRVIACSLLLTVTACNPAGRAWDSAKASGTAEAYQRFLAEYPDDPRAAEARRAMTSVHWERARAEGTIAAFATFLKENPAAPEVAAATEQIEELAWREASASGTVAAYDAFAKNYPSGRHAADASAALEGFAWKHAQNTATDAALRAFLAAYPSSVHAKAANAQIEVQREIGSIPRELLVYLGLAKGSTDLAKVCGTDTVRGKLSSSGDVGGGISILPGSRGAQGLTVGQIKIECIGSYGTEDWTVQMGIGGTVTFASGRQYEFDGTKWHQREPGK